MPVTVASLEAVLSLDTTKFDTGLTTSKTQLESFGKSLTTNMKTAAKVGSAALVGLGAGVVATSAVLIGLGSDAEEMLGKFDTVFGRMSEATKAELAEMSDALGRNKFDLMGFASALQDTFVPLGFTRKEAAGLSIDLTQLTVDMASFNNTTEQQALDDLQSAIVGNHETMRKYGVIITQSTLKQELLNMGIEGGIKEATEQEKVLARLNIIMAGTTDAQGDAIRTSESWANQMRSLKAQLAETATTMGLELLPAVTPLLKDLTSLAVKVLPQVTDIFVKFATALKDTIGPAITIIDNELKNAGFQFDTVGGILIGFEAVLNTVITAIQLGSMAIAGWIKFAGDIRKAWRFVSDTFSNVTEAIRRMGQQIMRLPRSLPSWLQMRSPPPLAQALTMIDEAAKPVRQAGLISTSASGGMALGATGQSVSNQSSSMVIQNLTVQANDPQSLFDAIQREARTRGLTFAAVN